MGLPDDFKNLLCFLIFFCNLKIIDTKVQKQVNISCLGSGHNSGMEPTNNCCAATGQMLEGLCA